MLDYIYGKQGFAKEQQCLQSHLCCLFIRLNSSRIGDVPILSQANEACLIFRLKSVPFLANGANRRLNGVNESKFCRMISEKTTFEECGTFHYRHTNH